MELMVDREGMTLFSLSRSCDGDFWISDGFTSPVRIRMPYIGGGCYEDVYNRCIEIFKIIAPEANVFPITCDEIILPEIVLEDFTNFTWISSDDYCPDDWAINLFVIKCEMDEISLGMASITTEAEERDDPNQIKLLRNPRIAKFAKPNEPGISLQFYNSIIQLAKSIENTAKNHPNHVMVKTYWDQLFANVKGAISSCEKMECAA